MYDAIMNAVTVVDAKNWKFKGPRRRRRGQRRLKNEPIFYLRISRYPKVF